VSATLKNKMKAHAQQRRDAKVFKRMLFRYATRHRENIHTEDLLFFMNTIPPMSDGIREVIRNPKETASPTPAPARRIWYI
jgi:hypothetical protein